MRVNELKLGKTAHNHLTLDVLLAVVLDERHDTDVLEVELAVVLCYDRSVGGSVTCHTTGVEGTERKLCTRLTNGLCGNHTYCLAHLNHALCCEVTSVTLHADTVLALAGEHRADLNALDGRVFDGLGDRVGNLFAGSHEQLAC